MKKLVITTFFALFLLTSPAFAVSDFCGWETPVQTRGCSEGYFFECRTWCQSVLSTRGWICQCNSHCTYIGECSQVLVIDEPETTDFKTWLREEAKRKAMPKQKGKLKKVK